MKYREEACKFGRSELIGISSIPLNPIPNAPAFIFLNAGLVHRVGPNRLHTKIARIISEKGYCCFRFDLSGIGDSPASCGENNLTRRPVLETQEAMNYMQNKHGCNQFILYGSCSGAYNAMKVSSADSRVTGLFLLNPISKFVFRNYMRHHLFNLQSLIKLLTFNFKLRLNLKRFMRIPKDKVQRGDDSDPAVSFEDLEDVSNKKLLSFIVFSQWDVSLDYFYYLFKRLSVKKHNTSLLKTVVIKNADHDLYCRSHQESLIDIIKVYLEHIESRKSIPEIEQQDIIKMLSLISNARRSL